MALKELRELKGLQERHSAPRVTKSGKPDKRFKSTKHTKLDPDKTVELYEKGVSLTDIAKAQDLHVSTVGKFLKRNAAELDHIAQFTENIEHHHAKSLLKDMALSERCQEALLEMPQCEFERLSPMTIKAIKAAADFGMKGKLDSFRLIRGESTANIAQKMMFQVVGADGKPVDPKELDGERT